MEQNHELYLTLWYGVFDRRTRRLRFVSGGHPPADAQREAFGEATFVPVVVANVALRKSVPIVHRGYDANSGRMGSRVVVSCSATSFADKPGASIPDPDLLLCPSRCGSC